MALNYRTILSGLRIFPKTTSTSDSQGELEVLSTDGKLYYHNGTTNSPLTTASSTDTITNKSFADNSTFIVDNSDPTKKIAFDAAGTTGTTTTITSSQTANRVLTLPDVTGTLSTDSGSSVLTNKKLDDSTVFFVDTGDNTKTIKFDAGGTTGTSTTITGAQTANRVLTLPDITDTLISRISTDTGANRLKNKELEDSTVKFVDPTDTTKKLAFDTSGSATGTTTSLNTSSTTINRTLTLPDATDTLVGKATTDTLTNKSISGSTNTITNVSLTTGVTGTLPIGNGGTNLTTYTTGDTLYASASNVLSKLPIGSSGQIYTVAAGIPSWATNTPASLGVTTQTNTNYTALTTDGLILVSTGNTNRTITLYAASGNSGKKLIIKKTDTGTGNVIIDANASETIDGALTVTLGSQYDALTIVCDGSNWFIEEDKRLIYATYSRNTAQAISDSTNTVVNFDVKEDDPMSLVTTGASWVFTVPVGGGGTYEINCTLYFSQSVFDSGESVQLIVQKNSTDFRGAISYAQAPAATPRALGCTMGGVLLNAVAGDTLDVYVRQNSGGSANVTADSPRCWISIKRASR